MQNYDELLKLINNMQKEINMLKQPNEQQTEKPKEKVKKQPKVYESIKKTSYKVTVNDEEKICKTLKEASLFTGKSPACLFRILEDRNVYKKKNSQDLKNIKIERIIKTI